ncbi:MAG: glycosyltransferase [Thermoproteaceae archaeon]|nr:glycosyltransferase [Thermoproteaceae archaeon]
MRAQAGGDFVSIVVVTYNSVSKLCRFFDRVIDSLARLDYDNYAVIFVDNASEDGTASYVERAMRVSGRRYLIVRLAQNRGLPYAYNVGAVTALKAFPQTRCLLFMNDDVILSEDSVRHLAEGLRGSCKAVQPVIVHLDGHREVGFKVGLTGYVEPVRREELRTSSPLIEVPVVSGAALMVDRDAFLEAGMFDGDMFWGYDDVDFCWRLHKRGYATCISTRAHVVHYGSATWGRENPAKHYYNTRNLIYMFYKNRSLASATALTPVLLLEVLRVLHWRLRRGDGRGVKAILSGVINGFRRVPSALKKASFMPLKTPPGYLDPAVDLRVILGRFYGQFRRGH